MRRKLNMCKLGLRQKSHLLIILRRHTNHCITFRSPGTPVILHILSYFSCSQLNPPVEKITIFPTSRAFSLHLNLGHLHTLLTTRFSTTELQEYYYEILGRNAIRCSNHWSNMPCWSENKDGTAQNDWAGPLACSRSFDWVTDGRLDSL